MSAGGFSIHLNYLQFLKFFLGYIGFYVDKFDLVYISNCQVKDLNITPEGKL